MAVTPQPGDVVLAANEETGEVAYKEVVRTFVNTTDEITHVTIENAEGEQETIDSTPEHPFYVEGLGWVEASSLHAGMTIWFANGTKGTVEDISNEGLEEPVTVYNFEVADFHTYFVGECRVLVHNACSNTEVGSSDNIDTVADASNILDPKDIRYSQSSVNGSEEKVKNMREKGWDGPPIDVVEMPDGMYTTLDNTRVVAAREVGINVEANIHGYGDLLPEDQIERFTTYKGTPSTWGEAVELRVGKQKSSFRRNNPYGSFDMENIK